MKCFPITITLLALLLAIGLLSVVVWSQITGRFTERAGIAGVADSGRGAGAAWGDYDNDGDLDLYVVNTSQQNRLYRNNGDETFTEVGADAGVDDIGSGGGTAWGDYDNDGNLDLYVARSSQSNRLYYNNGDGTFTETSESAGVDDRRNSRSVAWGDYDNDGYIDLYVANDGRNRLYHNNGDGTFTDVGEEMGVDDDRIGEGAAWGDYNNDEYLDLYVTNGRGGIGIGDAPNRLYQNNGDGTFSEVSNAAGVNDGGNGRGAAWGDYDNDGDIDLYVSNSDETLGVINAPNRLFRNNGDGTFAEIGAAANVDNNGDGRGASWADYDNDGYLDLYAVLEGRNQIYRNDGSNRFTELGSSLKVDDTGEGVNGIWGDYDQDGWFDIYLVNDNQSNRLYRNDGSGHQWLTITLIGSLSNKNGIGAKITAVTGSKRQRRDIDGGSGYFSQSALTTGFGFGTTTLIDSLIVLWPSGQQQVLTQMATNQHLTISEVDIIPDLMPPQVHVFPTQMATEGRDHVVTAHITDDNRIRVARLVYRPSSRTIWTDSLSMVNTTDSTFTASIPGHRVTRRGLTYSVRAQDVTSNVTTAPSQNPPVQFTELRSQGLSLPSGENLSSNDFRMISIPALLPDQNPVSVLGPTLNPSRAHEYDITSWRLFRWLEGEYLEYPDAGVFEPGQAYWLITSTPIGSIDVGDAISTTDRIRTVTITPGWNQIGTPYLFSTSISTILNENSDALIEPAIWRWTGSGYEQATELSPWQGYWIRNLETEPYDLKIPMNDALNAKPTKPVTPIDSEAWSLQLAVFKGNLQDTVNHLGVNAQASVQWDPFDISEPPGIGEGNLSLSFLHDQWPIRPGKYASDIRPPHSDGHFWAFTIESDQSGTPVTLEIKGVNQLPSDLSLLLVDLDQSHEQNIRTRSVYTFTEQDHQTTRHFLLVAGSSAYVKSVSQSIIPGTIDLKQNVPNPFNPSTTISFSIPESKQVQLRIYNILGQEVRVLLDEIRPAGRHTVQWHGRNNSGHTVASGVYIYQLQVGKTIKTRKMVLLR